MFSTDLSSDNKKTLLTTRNVRLDSGHYATNTISKLRNLFLHLKIALSTFGCVEKNHSDESDPILLKLKSENYKKNEIIHN